ncbi:hypothetical protein [Paenibacillus residui]|uniref:Uncharacterized protein n=1 Tax=Paenibacillus residui TaxID=629724 RepID=A0ABW3DA71_9BACL
MSLKSIDMQLAVHKSPEAGIKQNEIQQKPVHDQNHLTEQTSKQTDRERHVTSKSEAPEQAGIRDGEERRERNRGSGNGRKKTSGQSGPVEEKRPQHPYKGKIIDMQL